MEMNERDIWERMLITTFFLQTGPDEPTARVRLARSTPPTRLPSTRRARTLFPPKESDDTTESNPVTVVRLSLSSTRRLRPALCPFLATILSPQQTKKVVLRLECTVCKTKHQLALKRCKHFELGGDKKQRGAAISF
ncbi:60S ribosomal protein L44 [Cryptococcus deuterogattii R265]|uniref:60S ribosomal protein L44 n=1 Tax=Cryptococcus deuterogattii (strain R265) TaxID=294750 RepID=UPI0019362D28|nr:60S ribosomal protein L44 [Cryptococcus deuterogattii R265]